MTITGFEDVEEMLNKLANPYEMAEKAVNKAAPIVEKNLKTQIRSAANRRELIKMVLEMLKKWVIWNMV